MVARARLGKGRTVDTDAPALAVDGPVLVTGVPARSRAATLARGLGGLAALLALVTVGTYLAVASTIITPLSAGERTVLVVRGAYPIGQVPPDAYVYVAAGPVDRSVLGKIEQAVVGLPNGSVVQVVAAPPSQVQSRGGTIVVDGQPTRYAGDVTAAALRDRYLAVCVTGACGTPGDAVLVPTTWVVGKADGYLDGTSRTPITAPVQVVA